MDEIDGSRVNLNILLDGGLLSLFGVAGEFSVQESETKSHSVEAEEFNDGPVHVEHHG